MSRLFWRTVAWIIWRIYAVKPSKNRNKGKW
jgi:hypothetical protein